MNRATLASPFRLAAASLLAIFALAASPPAEAGHRSPDGARGTRGWQPPGGGHDGYEEFCARDVDQSFAALDQALNELADDIDLLKSGRDKRRMREDLQKLADAAEAARDHACRRRGGGPPVIVAPPPPPPPPPRAPMLDGSTHDGNIAAMRRESFDDGKVRIIDTALRGDVCVTSKQATDYMRLMSFSSNRLDVLRRLAPRLVNDGQAVSIFGALDFESEKEDARRLLTSTATLPPCRLPWR